MARANLDDLDRRISNTMWRIGIPVLRTSLAIVFVWFGVLKVVGSSPATDLVSKTVYWFDPTWFVPFLGWWEVTIGACLAVPALTRLGIALLAFQMPGTFLPLLLLPEVCYSRSFFHLSLEGQYIIKNVIIIGSALVLGGLVREHAPRSRS